jgi:hypothetical protein
VQDEGVSIDAKFCNNERHTSRHQTGNEGHVARQTIQLGDYDCAFRGT